MATMNRALTYALATLVGCVVLLYAGAAADLYRPAPWMGWTLGIAAAFVVAVRVGWAFVPGPDEWTDES